VVQRRSEANISVSIVHKNKKKESVELEKKIRLEVVAIINIAAEFLVKFSFHVNNGIYICRGYFAITDFESELKRISILH